MIAPVLTSADVRFDPIAHVYTLPDGRKIPGVTEILSAVGVSVDFDALSASSARRAAAIELKRDLGHALHADAHSFDDDDLDLATVDPRVLPYLRAWVTFRENSGVVPMTRERRLYHHVYGYAGTLDGIFRLPNGRQVLIDIKTGDPNDSACAFQTAAYQAAFEAQHPDRVIHERWGVQLAPDRAVPYLISPYTDWQDFAKFQAFLTTFHHQAARRGRRAA